MSGKKCIRNQLLRYIEDMLNDDGVFENGKIDEELDYIDRQIALIMESSDEYCNERAFRNPIRY